MNRDQIISEFTRVNRKYEALYFPKVEKAIASKKKDVVIKLNSGGISYARNWLATDLGNTLLTDVITDLYKTVGLRHARMNYSRMLNENGRKGHIIGMEVKGFGFSEIWTNYIINYFRKYLLEKITYKVAETTKTALLAILATATTEGWSVDQTVDKIEGWNERYQAARIVRTEVGRAANVGAKANSDTLSYEQQKEWVSAHDNRVRGKKPGDHANHVKLDKTKIDAEEKFVDSINGDQLDFPGDVNASAESVINCRCMVVYTAKRDQNGNLIPKKRSTTAVFPA